MLEQWRSSTTSLYNGSNARKHQLERYGSRRDKRDKKKGEKGKKETEKKEWGKEKEIK